jgi:Na+/melibiose symporter-like transporter
MNNRKIVLLCLLGGAVAFGVIIFVAIWGADKWGFPFVAIGLGIMFFLAFAIEFLERRSTSRPRQEVLPPEPPPALPLERHR